MPQSQFFSRYTYACMGVLCNTIYGNEILYLYTLKLYIFSVAKLTCLECKDIKTRNKISKPHLQNRYSNMEVCTSSQVKHSLQAQESVLPQLLVILRH